MIISAEFKASPSTRKFLYPYKHSDCAVLVLPRAHVELSRDLTITTNRYLSDPYFHSEFILFLKQPNDDTINRSYISYKTLVESYKPAAYLEINDFARVSFICCPCIESDLKTDVLPIPIESRGRQAQLTLWEIRKMWIRLHRNLHGTQFAAFSYWFG